MYGVSLSYNGSDLRGGGTIYYADERPEPHYINKIEENMPLKPGKQNIGNNIAELMNKYETTGSIGNQKPKNKRDALRIATAIAMSNAKPKKVVPVDQTEEDKRKPCKPKK